MNIQDEENDPKNIQINMYSFTKAFRKQVRTTISILLIALAVFIIGIFIGSVGFEDRDPTTFASNFKPLEQAVCANCHQAKKATDSCLTCHNYHVGEFTQAMPTTNDMLATNNN